MINVDRLKTAFIGLVSWRQNDDPSAWQLTELTTGTSGEYFNDAHALLTMENVASVAPRFDTIHATTSEINTAFTNWLKGKTEAAIIKSIRDWYASKNELMTARDLLKSETLFSPLVGGYNIVKDTRFEGNRVGYEIGTKRAKSLNYKINRVGLTFDVAQSIDLRLWKNGNVTPADTLSIVYDTPNQEKFFTTEWTLDPNSVYWIEYTVGDLANKSASINAITSNGGKGFPRSTLYHLKSFRIEDNTTDFWNVENNIYDTSTNYGLNLDMDIFCDYTDFIIDKKERFVELIKLRVAVDLLSELTFNANSRVNRNEANISKQDVMYELDGDSQGRGKFSLKQQYENAVKSLAFDSSGIDKICLPCRRKSARSKTLG